MLAPSWGGGLHDYGCYYVKQQLSHRPQVMLPMVEAVPGFPRGGRQPYKGSPTYYSSKFFWKLHESEKRGREGIRVQKLSM